MLSLGLIEDQTWHHILDNLQRFNCACGTADQKNITTVQSGDDKRWKPNTRLRSLATLHIAN